MIVNGILQDTDRPLMYLRDDEESRLKAGALIVDISCDRGMGFPFARPTSFERPTFDIGPVTYYAVDHTPSYLWQSASWEISRVVVAFLDTVMAGPEAWGAERNHPAGHRDSRRSDPEPEDLELSESLPGLPAQIGGHSAVTVRDDDHDGLTADDDIADQNRENEGPRPGTVP